MMLPKIVRIPFPLNTLSSTACVVETRSCSTKRATSALTAPMSVRRSRKPVLICSSDLYAVKCYRRQRRVERSASFRNWFYPDGRLGVHHQQLIGASADLPWSLQRNAHLDQRAVRPW